MVHAIAYGICNGRFICKSAIRMNHMAFANPDSFVNLESIFDCHMAFANLDSQMPYGNQMQIPDLQMSLDSQMPYSPCHMQWHGPYGKRI